MHPQTLAPRERVLFALLFLAVSVAALQVTLTPLHGANLRFNLFDLFAPVAAGFLGTVPGVSLVLGIGVVNFLLHQTFSFPAILHVFPAAFGAWYFGTNRQWIKLIPLLAIVVFVTHPVGREVWYYALFWTIPLVVAPWKERSLFTRALGATFTAHAVGGMLWITFVPLPASVWQGLVPIVAVERLLFALTATGVYLALAKVLTFLRLPTPAYARGSHTDETLPRA